MTDFDDKAREMDEALGDLRRLVGVLTEYFDSLLAADFSREEALALTRDFQKIQWGKSDES